MKTTIEGEICIMKDLFVMIDDQPQVYNGEILKRLVGDKIVKVISNPTEKDLKEFNYMELVHATEIPEYDQETQMIETSYKVQDGKIYELLQVVDVVAD